MNVEFVKSEQLAFLHFHIYIYIILKVNCNKMLNYLCFYFVFIANELIFTELSRTINNSS